MSLKHTQNICLAPSEAQGVTMYFPALNLHIRSLLDLSYLGLS